MPPVVSGYSDMPTPVEASRFLTQSTFGPTLTSIDALSSIGFSKWYADQVAVPQTLLQPAIETIERNWQTAHNTTNSQITGILDVSGFSSLWWATIPQAPDQLRQRVAFTLSEIFVVSMQDNRIKYLGAAVSNYYDMLARDAFGTYRNLLEDVTLHPVMGNYLTWVGNKKETYDSTGAILRTPDENYAREVMQLFSIGLVKLNIDASPQLDSKGRPIPTYSHDDVAGLAKVLTGWNADPSANAPIWATAGTNGVPMIPNSPSYHSTAEKKFLGVTIAATSATSSAAMKAELSTALDTLANHPNVGPFFAKQLIQKLVTSNPSPAYIARVATVFNNNGSGVRGDLKAVVRAVLMDKEAHDAAKITDPTFGKLREPILRFSHWARAFGAFGTGTPPVSNIGSTADAASALNESPMDSPSVFNFFNPGYTASTTLVGAAGLLAGELQITDEQSIVGYQNFIASLIEGNTGLTRSFVTNTSAELALVDDSHVDALLDRLNLELMAGELPSTIRADVRNAVVSIALTDAAGSAKGDTERKRRLWTAVYLLMSAPEYIVQK